MAQTNPDVDELKQMLTEAIATQQVGQVDKAMQMYEKVLKVRPDNFVANQFYGAALHQKRRFREAIPYFKKALKGNPTWGLTYSNLALTLHTLGRNSEALKYIEEGLKHEPRLADLHSRRCRILSLLGRHQDAVKAGRIALSIDPENIETYLNLAAALYESGDMQQAMQVSKNVVQKFPDSASACSNIGVLYQSTGHDEKAIEWYLKALEIDPHLVGNHNNLATIYRAADDYEKSLYHYDRALELQPDFAVGWSNRGNVLRAMGMGKESMESYEKAMELDPSSDTAHSNYLMSLHYSDNIPREEIYKKTLEWDEKFGKVKKRRRINFPNALDPDKKLRVGLVSNSFRKHPVGYMIVRALENMDPDKVEFYTFSGVPEAKNDQITKRIYEASEKVFDVVQMPNDELDKLIREQAPDLLVDLSGHSETGRLVIFCHRVAPVQVEWVGGLFDTTGLQEMDWIIGDDVEIPEGDEEWYTEKVYRMPDDYVCYDPPDYLADVGPLPAKENGYLTFGNYNNLAKVSDTMVGLWSRILKSLPDSRLILKTKGASQEAVSGYIHDMFKKHDIDVSRVVCEEGAPHKEFLASYNNIDIALDPWPYTGGLTTIEALCMGVPVITMPGETFAGRHAATHLTTVGLEDWIAQDADEYHDLAIKWANDLDGLEKLRSGLRDKVLGSPLCDGSKFAENLENAFRHMWRDYCEKNS